MTVLHRRMNFINRRAVRLGPSILLARRLWVTLAMLTVSAGMLCSQALASDETEAERKQQEKPAGTVEKRTNWPLGKIEPVLQQKVGAEAALNVIFYLGGTDIEKVVAEAKQAHMKSIEDHSKQLRQFQDEWRKSYIIDSLPEDEEKRTVRSLTTAKTTEAIQVAEALDDALSVMRVSVHESLRHEVSAGQEEIVRLIETNGGTVTGRIALVNAVAATIPNQALAVIASHPMVHTVVEDQPSEDALDVSVPALEYSAWFNVGFDGGVWDFGIQEGVQVDHPALNSHNQCSRPGSAASQHGTHVAGIAASTDILYTGGAFGLDKIVWARTSVSPNQTVMMSDMEWMMGSNACDNPEVVNYSSGHGIATTDYVTNDSFYDAYIPTYSALVSQAAGNENWSDSQCTMLRPATAYNHLVVAAMNDRNTISISDDVRRESSSVGPTPGGRNKPDITAPGQDIMSCNINWATGPDFIPLGGTSMAAPHVSAAILLMQDGGITNDMAQKAILINTANAWDSNNTESTADDGPVSGSHWDKSYGWGYLDMWEAYFNRNDYFLDSVIPKNDNEVPDDYHLYKGYMYNNEKATLVWRKRFSGYTSGRPPAMTYDLSDIDLQIYDEEDGTFIDNDVSAINNVHQVANDSGSSIEAVIKVYSYSTTFDGASSEPYALATEENFIRADPPSFSPATTAPATVPLNYNLPVTLYVTNDGDVAAFNNVASLIIPAGFSIISGANPQNIGTIAAGATKTASWTLRAYATVGSYTISFGNSSNSYAETYTGFTSRSITVGYDSYDDELAGDFGTNGLWHYDGTSWSKLTWWNPDDDLAGWSGGMAVDFGGEGLWNHDGISWSKKTPWNPGSGGLAGWSGGLAVDFNTNGLWNYDGISWSKKTPWNPGSGGLASWSGGLAVDFDAAGLWSYDGSSWRKLTPWNPEGMADWNGSLGVDFGGNGLWSYDGSSWRKLTPWNPEGMSGWNGSLGVDFGGNGLWSYDGSSWRKLTPWNSTGMSGWGGGLAVDFGTNGLWNYDGTAWSKKTPWHCENMADVDLN